MIMTESPLTPMMAQWHACKQEAKDALLFFRLGDFYEAFHDDALLISKEIGVTLTSRQGTPMCGVPFHTAESYIDKLLVKGYKIAVAEQTEDPKNTKGLVKREITRIVTPGTVVSSQLISDKKNNFFASIAQAGTLYGLSYMDLTTGEFYALELDELETLINALHRIRPAEILVEKKFIAAYPAFFQELSHAFPFLLSEKPDGEPGSAYGALALHFDVSNLDSFGLRGKTAAILAAGTLLLHLKEDLNLNLEQITTIQRENLSQTMSIDRSTLRHLELDTSVFNFLDETATPMGGRLLVQWLKAPLLCPQEIEHRQNKISLFLDSWNTAEEAHKQLESMRDLQRLIMKVVAHMASPRDLYALGVSLSPIPHFKALLATISGLEEANAIFDPTPIFQKILSAMNPSPPLRIGEGEIFQDGFHPELDMLRQLSKDSLSWMARYQNTLREQTGIKTLKVGFTKAFGYYIEVSRSKSEKIPDHFQRRQTLVNGERFITEELKEFEHRVLTAEERSKALEAEIFESLRSEVAKQAPSIHQAASVIAKFDVLLALAKAAKKWQFVRPLVDESDLLEIHEGRHPLVERMIGRASFIPNDTLLSKQKQMMLITGPNMAGKSTYIRQVALIVILAQMGSFVPASSAHIGRIDQVFSRIGASDDLSKGQSTFMVEMAETANILQNATSRSLVLLDEIGRGTSTYDGIAIAWSVAEFLLTTVHRQAKTLFATHYWELTRLEEQYPHAGNYQTAVQETPSGIVFLHKIISGGTDKSYGIHVAKLAGLPAKVIRRAEEMLLQLEAKSSRKKTKNDDQLLLFASTPTEDPSGPMLPAYIADLKALDLNQITPMQALQKLLLLQQELKS